MLQETRKESLSFWFVTKMVIPRAGDENPWYRYLEKKLRHATAAIFSP